jgi:ATP-dependent exoDNAse (exonuclease V) alpha subunit
VLTRELLYTGVTRAKSRLSWWVPNASVLFNSVGQRVTRSGGLADALFHPSKWALQKKVSNDEFR